MPQVSDPKTHWEQVYSSKSSDSVSWFQKNPATSLALISTCNPDATTRLIDVGCGASQLVDQLLSRGLCSVSLLDVSATALEIVRLRLGDKATQVTFFNSDITHWQPASRYDIWHDRAVLHFLVQDADRCAYLEQVKRALKSGGFLIIGSFALDGPEKCSGLPVQRYSADSLSEFLGEEFVLLDDSREEHITPAGRVQAFQFCRFVRQ
ncbi:MAG: class I SAM-dependent methyltransferase [Gammaproteobacteria bacterium]